MTGDDGDDAVWQARPLVLPSSTRNLAGDVREHAAAIVTIGATAARLGVKVDVGAAIAKGIDPDVLRSAVLDAAAERDEATVVMPTSPTPSTRDVDVKPAQSASATSPIVAAARQAAAAAGSLAERER